MDFLQMIGPIAEGLNDKWAVWFKLDHSVHMIMTQFDVTGSVDTGVTRSTVDLPCGLDSNDLRFRDEPCFYSQLWDNLTGVRTALSGSILRNYIRVL